MKPSVDDPIKMGLVASLNRPSGNATGMSLFTDVLAAKQLELIRELVPKASAIGILVNPDNPITEVNLRHTQDEAHKLGLTVHVLKASTKAIWMRHSRPLLSNGLRWFSSESTRYSTPSGNIS